MKAIHNTPLTKPLLVIVGNYKLKYNFESNSQRLPSPSNVWSVGNYKLKYNFESNSQHTEGIPTIAMGWEL